MPGELKALVARGVAWSMAEKAGSTLLQLAVSILTLRLLMPEDFGVVAILTAFSAVALIVVDSGFSQTLIRKIEPQPNDYKSVFLFNITVSVLLYLLLVGLSPVAAWYYGKPIITSIAPVFFLQIPVNALCVIQNTIFTRQFRFSLMSKVVFISSLISGAVAICMALAGCGVWSIVAQQLTAMIVRAGLMWWFSTWRPTAHYDSRALKEMAPYSLNLMATDLISTLYNKIPQLFLGKVYSIDALGYFDQARKFKDQSVTSVVMSVQNVTFPALSKIAGDEKKFAESYRQVILVVAYVMFPAMIGLIAVSEDLFAVLVGEKWMPTVPYLRVICLTGLFYPIAMIAYNVLKVKSDGKIIVRLEIVKKIVMTVIFVVTIPHSVMAVVWGLVAMSLFELLLNFFAATRFSTLSVSRVLRTLLPIVLVTAAMYGVVWGVGVLLPDNPPLRLVVQLLSGVASYALFSALFRLAAFREVLAMVRKQMKR
ncbi:MAG: lipopolysaccharide biosynthesis protein [Alistipes sp.]